MYDITKSTNLALLGPSYTIGHEAVITVLSPDISRQWSRRQITGCIAQIIGLVHGWWPEVLSQVCCASRSRADVMYDRIIESKIWVILDIVIILHQWTHLQCKTLFTYFIRMVYIFLLYKSWCAEDKNADSVSQLNPNFYSLG